MSIDIDNPHSCQLATLEKCGREKLEKCARCQECVSVRDLLNQCQILDLWEDIFGLPDPAKFIENKLSVEDFKVVITGFFQKIISQCSITPANPDLNLPAMPIPWAKIPRDERLIIKVLKQIIEEIKQSEYEIDMEESVDWIEKKILEKNL